MGDLLQGRTAIVTGGGHGIGRAYCLGLAAEGANVVVADIDGGAADEVSNEVTQSLRAQSVSMTTDVTDADSTRSMAQTAFDRFGRIDVLVNNAAVYVTMPVNRGGIESIDSAEWDSVMDVNLKGLFLCSRSVLPIMRQQRYGKIVNISSGTWFKGSPGMIHYVTSKAGVVGFTRTLAREVGGDNITVNAIAPGSTLSEENPTEEIMEFRRASVGSRALQRVQVPDDLVGALLFLSSPLSDFITGQTLVVDGGSVFV